MHLWRHKREIIITIKFLVPVLDKHTETIHCPFSIQQLHSFYDKLYYMTGVKPLTFPDVWRLASTSKSCSMEERVKTGLKNEIIQSEKKRVPPSYRDILCEQWVPSLYTCSLAKVQSTFHTDMLDEFLPRCIIADIVPNFWSKPEEIIAPITFNFQIQE